MMTPIRSCFNCGNLKGCAGCSAEGEAPINAVCATGEDRPSHWQPKPEIAEMSARLDLALRGVHVAAELLTRNLRFLLAFDTATLNEDLTEDEEHEAAAIGDRLLQRAAAELRQTAAAGRPEVDAPMEVGDGDRCRAWVDGWCSVEDVERILSGTDLSVSGNERVAVIQDAIAQAWRGILTAFPTLPEKTRENELAHIRLAGAFAWARHAPYLGMRLTGMVGGEHILICDRASGASTALRWFNDALKQLRAQGADATLIKEIAE
jgi:hypothetical protein